MSSQVTKKFSRVIREAGLKVTKSRLAVLEALADLGGHNSADEVHNFLLARGREFPRGTVFKVVNDLSQTGVLMITDAGPGRTLYEYAEEWHHHFVCRICGDIIDVPCMENTKPCLQPCVELAGVVEEAQIIFRGVCHSCRPNS